jgi:hypothetical protein
LCGNYFGGHEATMEGAIMRSWDSSEGTCPDCVGKAKEYNKKWMKNNPFPDIVFNKTTVLYEEIK